MPNIIITAESLLRSLSGVSTAARTAEADTQPVSVWITEQAKSSGDPGGFDLAEWASRISEAQITGSNHSTHVEATDYVALARLAVVAAFLRETSRRGRAAAADELGLCWRLAHASMTTGGLGRGTSLTAARSAQGFLAVPFCSILKDGNIDELIRLHVWLPDGKRGNPDFALHSHQSFARSWILAGQGTDHSYQVEPIAAPDDAGKATHATYSLAWDDGKGAGTSYKTHQAYSIIKNTGALFRATETRSVSHLRNTTYTIPAGAFHRSEIGPLVFHATFFFFDSQCGFVHDAGVLGPKDKDSFKAFRDPAGVTPAQLAMQVEASREWEVLMDQGRQYAQRTEWEKAFKAYNSALQLCNEPGSQLPIPGQMRQLVQGELGCTNRRFGRYKTAVGILKPLVAGMEPSAYRVEFSGELGVCYRHMNQLGKAARVFKDQLDSARNLGLDLEVCRALGNLGMVNYQLSLEATKDDKNPLLDLAIRQLEERVAVARKLRSELDQGSNRTDASTNRLRVTLNTWETIGLDRLSLCHSFRGDVQAAVNISSWQSSRQIRNSPDATVRAMSRFFYGRALLLQGRHDEALALFNEPRTCSPAIAFAKEPSTEHRGYLRELIAAGADMEIVDEQGYTALDHAVLTGTPRPSPCCSWACRRGRERRESARSRGDHAPLRTSVVRKAYARALAADVKKQDMFDGLRYVNWLEFASWGELRRSGVGVARRVKDGDSNPSFFIFISYRWLNKTPGTVDDEQHKQYNRMKDAVTKLLALPAYQGFREDEVGVWVDYACVDQDQPASGVAALPLVIAQCDAIVSLVDAEYYSRGWCAVEVMIAQTLRASFGIHQWWEHVPATAGVDAPASGVQTGSELRVAESKEIDMKDKLLSFESDRPQVLFLERQSKLLG